MHHAVYFMFWDNKYFFLHFLKKNLMSWEIIKVKIRMLGDDYNFLVQY